ncbi:MAG: hypothetical protein M0Z85_02345 [Gammaproteobacteria bacterium]|nr:hypothetical protein [Gammaproteobacteria bacterium]
MAVLNPGIKRRGKISIAAGHCYVGVMLKYGRRNAFSASPGIGLPGLMMACALLMSHLNCVSIKIGVNVILVMLGNQGGDAMTNQQGYGFGVKICSVKARIVGFWEAICPSGRSPLMSP